MNPDPDMLRVGEQISDTEQRHMREFDSLIHIGERNDCGGAPEDNRDALGHASLLAGHLLVLASGVGGTAGGRLEGNLAVSTVLTHFRTTSGEPVHERLAHSFCRANEVLTARAERDPSLRGTGAACAAMLVEDGCFHAARAGDVKILVIRQGVTTEILRSDQVPENSEQKNRSGAAAREGALGAGSATQILVSSESIQLAPQDRIVLASPGLHERVPLNDLVRIAVEHVPQVAAGRLVDEARKHGATSGISVQVIFFGDPTAASVGAAHHEPMPIPSAPRQIQAAPTPVQSMPAADVQAPSPVVRTPEEPAKPRVHAISNNPTSPEPAMSPDYRNHAKKNQYAYSRGVPYPSNTNTWVVPVGLAASILFALWIWAPWSSSSTDTDDESQQPAVAETPAAPNSDEFPTAAIEPDDFNVGSDSNDTLKMALTDVGITPNGFWKHVNETMENGSPISDATIEAWLAEEDPAAGSIDERARARLAELKTVERSLLAMTIDPDAITPQETARLDRIFRLPAKDAALKLNRYVKDKHSSRGDAVFKSLSVYIQTHRSPEVTRVCMEMMNLRPKPGPRTRKWLSEELPEVLAGP